MRDETALKSYFDPNTPLSVFESVGKQFLVRAPHFFDFLREEYGYKTKLSGIYSDIGFLAKKDDLIIRVEMEKYLIESYITIIGPSELLLLKENCPTNLSLQTIEKCRNPNYLYERSVWNELTYVEKELRLFSSILKKYIKQLSNGEALVNFFRSLSDCSELRSEIKIK